MDVHEKDQVRKIADAVRVLSADAIELQQSGHPGWCWARPMSVRTCTARCCVIILETPTGRGTLSGVVRDALGAPIPGAVVQVGRSERTTDGSGAYTLQLAPGRYTAQASAAGYVDATAGGIAIADRAAVLRDFTLARAPRIVPALAAIFGGNDDGLFDLNECNEMIVSLRNAGSGPATGVWATLSTPTPGVVVDNPVSRFPDMAAGDIGFNLGLSLFRISTRDTLTPGQTIEFLLDVHTAEGVGSSIPLTVPCGKPPVTVSSTDVPLAIPDNTPAGVAAAVGVGTSGTVADVNLSIQTTHTWIGDLIYTLTHNDTGRSVVVIDRPGVPTSGAGCSSNHINATLDDDSALPVESQWGLSTNPTPPPYAIDGAFTPNNPLSAFDGEDLTGTWTLTASDNAGADVGTGICQRRDLPILFARTKNFAGPNFPRHFIARLTLTLSTVATGRPSWPAIRGLRIGVGIHSSRCADFVSPPEGSPTRVKF